MPPKIIKQKKKAWTEIHQDEYIWLFNVSGLLYRKN